MDLKRRPIVIFFLLASDSHDFSTRDDVSK